jgi:NADH-quinone oxidoreductase subunit A
VSNFEQWGTLAIFVIVGCLLYAVDHARQPHHAAVGALPAEAHDLRVRGRGAGVGWSQTNIRYYIFAFLFVIFDVEAIFLFPWAVIIGDLDATTRVSPVFALVAMFLFIGTLLEGLAYAWKKGVLTWD